MFKWVMIFLFLVGCAGELSLISNSELEDATDLSLYLEEMRVSEEISISENNEENEEEVEEVVNLSQTEPVVMAQTSQEVSNWTEDLDRQVHSSSSGSKGKKFQSGAVGDDLVERGVANWTEDLNDEIHQTRETQGGKFRQASVGDDLVKDPSSPSEESWEDSFVNTETPVRSWGDVIGSLSNTNNNIGNQYEVLGGSSEVIQDLKPKVVDILIVLDVSYSTKNLRRNHMGDQFKEFLSNLSPMDWRLGVIQASTRNKGLLNIGGDAFITSQNHSEKAFLETIQKSKNGSSAERPLAALDNFLKSSQSLSFLREDSDGLAVVIVSDNDEGRLNFKGQMITSEHVIYNYHERFGYDKNIRGYALTVVNDRCRSIMKSTGSNEGKYAPVVAEFVDRTSGRGRNFNLCAARYAPVANAIASDFIIND